MSVCLSVCLSVTFVHCAQTAEDVDTIFLHRTVPYVSPRLCNNSTYVGQPLSPQILHTCRPTCTYNELKANVHRESKKGDTILLSISLLNIDRFSQFFHQRTQLELYNKIVNKDPTSPQMCCYTTLRNVFKKRRKTINNLNQVSCLTINQQIFNELHEPYPR